MITNARVYDYLNYKIVKDIIINKGPIGGIYLALANSDSEINLILSYDIQLISIGILRELIAKHNANFKISVFKDVEQIHPLIRIYSKKILSVLKKAIDENELKMIRFLTKVKTQRISIKNDKNNFLKT